MKIRRQSEISEEKKKKAPDWSNNKHYHKIEIYINDDTIEVKKTLYYITGHGTEECDDIYYQSNYNAIFKTQDINKINLNIENEIIKGLAIRKQETIDDNNLNIQNLTEKNIQLKQEIKKLSKLIHRKDKIKTSLK